MPHSKRCLSVRLVGMGIILLLGITAVTAEEPRNNELGDQLVPFSQGSLLPVDGELPRKLETLPDLIAEKKWTKVTHFLQSLLDAPEDRFLLLKHKGPDGKDVLRWTTVRKEVNRLLRTLPAEGLAFYELSYGQQARALIHDAADPHDFLVLSRVAQRFAHTHAGTEALERLATQHLDRGRALLAAVHFEQLLSGQGADKRSPLLLLTAIQAFEHAGDKAQAEQTWKMLAAQAPEGLRLSDRHVGLDELRQEVAKPGGRALEPPAEPATLFRGEASRSGRASGTFPLLEEVAWQQPTCAEATTRAWLTDAARSNEARTRPLLSESFLIAAGDRLIGRSHQGIHAFERDTGKTAWCSTSPWAFDALARDAVHGAHVASWVSNYLSGNSQVLVENSVLGTLSTDGTRVFAVDDLPLPPYPTNYPIFMSRTVQDLQLTFAPTLTAAIFHNRLLAIDVATGKVIWEVGGRRDGEKTEGTDAVAVTLADAYFLGPPLPLGGKLYAMIEQDQDLRLVCLEPASGAVIWTQTLAVVRNRMVLDGGRRMQAAPIAYAEGILVCPTNAGAVFAVEPWTHSLLWAFSYREEAPEPELGPIYRGRFRPRPVLPQTPPNLTTQWKAAAPILYDGKVILAAPDEATLHCLNLRDGTLLWRADRPEGGLFLGGAAAGRALCVGVRDCRALDLADGKVAWKVDTGRPAGQGVLLGMKYYLPLQPPERGKPAEICVIDMEQGTVVSRQPVPEGDGLGNLLLHNGDVFAQTATTVTAYQPK